MNKYVFPIVIGLLGEGLIALIIFVLLWPYFIGYESVLWLDFAVASITFCVWVLNSTFSPLNLKDPSQKGVGALGVKWYATTLYTVLAIGFMLLGLIPDDYNQGPLIPFPWQIVLQAVFLFIFIVLIFFSGKSSKRTEEVYYEEKEKKAGKQNIKASIQNLLYSMEDAGMPADLTAQVRKLSGETRFISPSISPEATMLDDRINASCQQIIYDLHDVTINRDRIIKNIDQLERDVMRRKQAR